MNDIKEQIEQWLAEDVGHDDITSSALIPDGIVSEAEIVAKQVGIACGIEYMEQFIEVAGGHGSIETQIASGREVSPGSLIATCSGDYKTLLKIERPFLNLMQHLSGIATQTREFVEKVCHTKAKIFDTRKTVPGLRLLAKEAVAYGGGNNHRMGLYDQFLIKENHLAHYRDKENPFASAIDDARKYNAEAIVVIEVETLEECLMAAEKKPHVILLDNMSTEKMQKAVSTLRESAPLIQLEASGGITIGNVDKVAETGVHRISVGSLTHSINTLDISMLIERPQ